MYPSFPVIHMHQRGARTLLKWLSAAVAITAAPPPPPPLAFFLLFLQSSLAWVLGQMLVSSAVPPVCYATSPPGSECEACCYVYCSRLVNAHRTHFSFSLIIIFCNTFSVETVEESF